MFNARKAQIFKSSRYSKFLIHLSVRKKWHILCLRIPVLKSKQLVLIRSAPTYLRCIGAQADQNMTNLRCTADNHAVPPLNIRPVESGIIPTIFNRLKNLSRSPRLLRAGPTNPRCILDQNTLSPIKARSLPIRQFFQRERAGVNRVSGVNGPLRFTHRRPFPIKIWQTYAEPTITALFFAQPTTCG